MNTHKRYATARPALSAMNSMAVARRARELQGIRKNEFRRMIMRKLFVTVAMGALLALPLWAQQKSGGTSESSNGAGETAEKSSAVAMNAVNATPASRSVFALPETPRPTPFPAAAPKETNYGRMLPRIEIAGMYDYANFNPGDPFNSFNNHGASGSLTYNASKWLGLTGEIGGFHYKRDVNGSPMEGDLATYLFGPRLNLRKFDYFIPFGEFLVGVAQAGISLTGDNAQSAFALATGGGVDIALTKNVAWRFAQIDYLMTTFSGSALGASARQNNLRLGTGLVLRFGIPKPPPPPNHPPVAACSATPTSVYAESGDSVAVHVNASDPDNDPLSYSYTATGGTVEGTGPDARWNSAGLGVGSYTVTAKVDDGRGGTASCAVDIKVEPRPNRPPVISCSVERSPILPGERTAITAVASDPDNDPLTFTWTASGGQIVGSGAKVQFDSTGLQPGSYNVKGTVSDGRGGSADCSVNVDVQQPPPPPQAVKVGDCSYRTAGSSRVDNVCKRVLDDVALRLKNEPTAKLVIVGFADPKEPKAAKLAATRADLAKKYLGEKGIDASRIATRTGEASKEKGAEKANRRIDAVFVPEGATY
jgi:outer membrane protein OmpA-like peptidoglycan-associated protein